MAFVFEDKSRLIRVAMEAGLSREDATAMVELSFHAATESEATIHRIAHTAPPLIQASVYMTALGGMHDLYLQTINRARLLGMENVWAKGKG